jgi:hypothetical protein
MNEYLIIIIGVLVALLSIILTIKFSSKFRKFAYKLFKYAETNVISGRKMDYVVNQMYELLPAPLRILPKSFYKKLLQSIFDEVHDMLDDGKRNKSVG